MDNLLLPYLNAADDIQREQRLDELLAMHAAPIIRQTLRRRLGFYVSAEGINEHNQDAEDLYQEAMARVVYVLHELRTASTPTVIKNFEHYVARIASNICIDFLRAKYPARTHLKDSLRDLFRRHKDLVSWEFENEILCGFAVWRGSGRTAFSEQASHDVEAKSEAFKSARFPDEDIQSAPLPQLVAELFDWIGGPVEIEVVVKMIAVLLKIREQPIESLDAQVGRAWNIRADRISPSGESILQARELLERLWQSVKLLQPEQRDSFVLGLKIRRVEIFSRCYLERE